MAMEGAFRRAARREIALRVEGVALFKATLMCFPGRRPPIHPSPRASLSWLGRLGPTLLPCTSQNCWKQPRMCD